MSTVVLGGNRFIECQSILAYRGTPVLQVAVEPLRVDLVTPENLPSRRVVRIGPNESNPPNDVRVVATDKSFAIFWRHYAIAVATLLDPETVHLRIDLRPLGIKIYDDLDVLHIGTNTFSGNEIRNAFAAINLAD